LASIEDPYIVQYHEAFYDKDISCLCVIMEFAGGGDILKQTNKRKPRNYFPERTIWRYFI
jgi:NIMA (never in mitosis gene a)-related kinase